MKTVRSLLLSTNVLFVLWGEVTLNAMYVINRISSTLTFGLSPIHTLYGFPPNYSSLYIFG